MRRKNSNKLPASRAGESASWRTKREKFVSRLHLRGEPRSIITRNSRYNKSFKLLIIVILFFVATLGVLQMFFSNSLATSGERLKALEEEKRRLEMDNEMFSNQLVELSSLSRISSESAKIGMVRPASYLYTSIAVPLAMGARVR